MKTFPFFPIWSFCQTCWRSLSHCISPFFPLHSPTLKPLAEKQNAQVDRKAVINVPCPSRFLFHMKNASPCPDPIQQSKNAHSPVKTHLKFSLSPTCKVNHTSWVSTLFIILLMCSLCDWHLTPKERSTRQRIHSTTEWSPQVFH